MDLLFFAPNSLTVTKGTVVFFLDNLDDDRNHNLVIADGSGNVLAGSATVKSHTKVVFTVQECSREPTPSAE